MRSNAVLTSAKNQPRPKMARRRMKANGTPSGKAKRKVKARGLLEPDKPVFHDKIATGMHAAEIRFAVRLHPGTKPKTSDDRKPQEKPKRSASKSFCCS